MASKVNYIQDRLTYFPEIGKRYAVITNYFRVYEDNEKDIKWEGPLPFWFYSKYRYMLQKITEFNQWYENIRRRYHEPSLEEIELHFRKNDHDDYDAQKYREFNIYYASGDTWAIEQIEKEIKEGLEEYELDRLKESYWEDIDSKSFDKTYYFFEPWTEEPCPPPFSDYTENLKWYAEQYSKRYTYSVPFMLGMLDFYAHTVPFFKGVNDERFIKELREAYQVVKKMSVLATVKEDLPEAQVSYLPDFDQFIVPGKITGEDQFYLLGYQDQEANFSHFKKQVLYGTKTSFENHEDYHKKTLESCEKEGLSTAQNFVAFQIHPISYMYLCDLKGEFHLPVTTDPRIMALVRGAVEAYCAYSEFMLDLLENDKNLDEDRKYLAQLPVETFLVKCCGLSLIKSAEEKTIVTSIVNWEDALEDYVNNGWTVEFTPAIALEDGRLQEVDEKGQFHQLNKNKSLQLK